MKVMLTWQLHPGKFDEIHSHFSHMSAEEEQALMGDDLKLIGRWHDIIRGSGAAIYETDNAVAVSTFARHWNPHMDMDVSIVLDDDECKAVGLKLEAGK